MRIIFLGALAAITFANQAYANNGLDISPAFKGTIVSTFPDGRSTKLWLARDGSYRATSRDGKLSNGHWKIEGERMCLRQEEPVKAPFDYCTDLPQRLDASWQGKSALGLPVTIKLVSGRI